MITSLLNDRTGYWVKKAKEVRKATEIDNDGRIFRLIKETSIKSPPVSETISEKDVAIIHFQSKRQQMIGTLKGTVKLTFSHTSITHHLHAG